MLFSSIPFLYYFLPAVMLLHFIVPARFKNTILFLFSMFFYFWGEPKYILLMVISIITGYAGGLVVGKLKQAGKEIIKEVEVINAEACPDHIHMYVSIPPKLSVSSFMGYLKGKSTLIIFERHANLKYKYGNRTFWCRGFYVSTVGNNKAAVYNYVQNQLKEDMISDQITIKEYKDPFKG